MKTQTLLAALSVCAISAVAAAALAQPADGGAPAAPNKALFEEKCSTCHGSSRVNIYQRSKEGWADTVDQMVNKGLVVSPEETDKIVAYLTIAQGEAPPEPAPAATPAPATPPTP